jgi:hypothetical protein
MIERRRFGLEGLRNKIGIKRATSLLDDTEKIGRRPNFAIEREVLLISHGGCTFTAQAAGSSKLVARIKKGLAP